MSKILFLLAISVSIAASVFTQTVDPTEGTLFASGRKGNVLGVCPLKNTRVRTDISGFIARVRVVQEFQNDFAEPIEAVYTFPLSHDSAVDDMTMTIGERVIKGRIMKRAAARRVYEAAKEEGKAASLLDQERPNIFTQAVANIPPGEKIVIEISYDETLKYEDGQYEFVFPMVVAPRYSPVTMKEEEAARVSPPISQTRTGHDISIEVNLDAGVPVESLRSSSHDIETVNLSSNSAKIALKDEKTIPNKDFILRYDVTGKRIEDALLAHRDARGGFFTLILQPPDKFSVDAVTPKEIVFVLDTSGSMYGRPIEKAREAMKLSLDGLYPDDTFNIITFAGNTEILFDKPVYATQANLEKAREFLDERDSSGGTEMMKAIKAALDPSDAQDHVRIVCFMTDGEVGNDNEIIAEIQRHPKARVFSFGIGDSVNRYLLDKMAAEGNGEHEYVGLNDDGSKAARKFYERVRTPLLTDISIDWGGLAVADMYPVKIPDLFSAKPVIIHGRYTKPGAATVRLRGKIAGQEYSRDIAVNLPESEADNDVLAPIWARRRIDDLIGKSLKYNAEADEMQLALRLPTKNIITSLALEYHLMTEFTSFVAVEDRIVTSGGKPRTVQMPVENASTSSMNGPEQAGDSKDMAMGAPILLVPRAVPTPAPARGQVARLNQTQYFEAPPVGEAQADAIDDKAAIAPQPPPIPNLPVNPSRQKAQIAPTAAVEATPTGSLGIPTGNSIENFDKMPIVSAGVLNGKSIELVHPVYPAAARAINANGVVTVQIVIDETGQVAQAKAISGHLLLRPAAEQAALRSKFMPLSLAGKPVKSTGSINYRFLNNVNMTIDLLDKKEAEDAEKAALTPEQQVEADRRQLLAGRLHFWVFAVVERVQKAGAPAPNEEKFVTGGNANIKIVLSANTPGIPEKIRAAGFVGTMEKGVLVGSVPVARFAELAAMPEVKFILPRMK
jgi:Ca-activated chloride channel homolog